MVRFSAGMPRLNSILGSTRGENNRAIKRWTKLNRDFRSREKTEQNKQ